MDRASVIAWTMENVIQEVETYAKQLRAAAVAGQGENEKALIDRFRMLARLCNKHGKKILEYRKQCAVGIAITKGHAIAATK